MNERLLFGGPIPIPRDFHVHAEDKDIIVRTAETHFVLRRDSLSRMDDLVKTHGAGCEVFMRFGHSVAQIGSDGMTRMRT